MARRICDICGKDKDVQGGKVCEKGHFVCSQCVHGSGLQLLGPSRTACPICGKKLR